MSGWRPALFGLALACAGFAIDAQDKAYQPLSTTETAAETTTTAPSPQPEALDAIEPPSALGNLPGRQRRSLNGQWQTLVDAYDDGIGQWKAIWKDRTASGKREFIEYGFDDDDTLQVPGDFNTQRPELHWYEGPVWYRKVFDYDTARLRREGRRLFVQFGGANQHADVFLNGQRVGSHDGGFTAFGFEITDLLAEGSNRLLVRVDNRRRDDALPARGFDWFNYGGLTRDVDLVETPGSHIRDYALQLVPGSRTRAEGWVQVDGAKLQQTVRLRIPELGVDVRANADAQGRVAFAFDAAFALWSPRTPKLYRVQVSTARETLEEDIGFRSIQVRGDEILLNGESVFLRGVNLHEEIDGGRAATEDDARRLLQRVKDLGANFARLAHYPHNEYLPRLADRMGVMLWQEIPVYQQIDFANPATRTRMHAMLAEMIGRDHNRASVLMWGIANETTPGPARNAALAALAQRARQLDATRLVTAAFYGPGFHGDTLTMDDPLFDAIDLIGANIYYGWYVPWPVPPEQVRWTPPGKPLLISEFGAEARYGQHGADDIASQWNEEFQARFYRLQARMLARQPFVRGWMPWVLQDFRSPVRLNPLQRGYNRKGLLSERGERKLAWHVIADAYRARAEADVPSEVETPTPSPEMPTDANP
ncbi:MAG: glycoside hydrolase family 2 TIM barrel-domain containing protein [Pseudoxanthomonas sp.]